MSTYPSSFYNVVDFGSKSWTANNSGSTAASDNTACIQGAVTYAQSHGGGIIILPDVGTDGTFGIFYVSGIVTIDASVSSASILIMGTGTTILKKIDGLDMFDINGSTSESDNLGVGFQDFAVIYDPSITNATGTAFNFNIATNGRLFRIYIENAPTAVTFENTGQCSMLQCTVAYTSAYSNTSTSLSSLQITGAQTWIDQCLFKYQGGTTVVQTAVTIGESSYTHLIDSQFSDFPAAGIVLDGALFKSGSPGTIKGPVFMGVRVSSPSYCVQTKPKVYDAAFIECHFQATDGTTPATGLFIDNAGSGINGDIDTIRFVSCNCKQYASYGLQINAGQNIQVTGGCYSGNGSASTGGGVGIAITGPATEVQIVGANCAGPTETNSFTQQYGISITGGQDIQLIGVICSGTGTSLTGNAGTGIYINGTTVSDVRITGAICNGSLFGNTAEQRYGIYVKGASGIVIDSSYFGGNTAWGIYLDAVVNGVTISNCDFYANADGGINIIPGGLTTSTKNIFVRDCNIVGASSYATAIQTTASTGYSNVQITNSAGYNDQKPHLATSVPSGTFSGSTHNYYGPVVFYYWGGTGDVTIDGVATTLTFGSFELNPVENASIASGGGGSFIMIGK
ncbi:MAG TPA: right-handed parallel beta-helix repeat-containing protein [Candidatus Binatia bacterium]|nr:right-handed parallel beta-helix repeat-containing protein [Candidatus Binatia bacterium]